MCFKVSPKNKIMFGSGLVLQTDMMFRMWVIRYSEGLRPSSTVTTPSLLCVYTECLHKVTALEHEVFLSIQCHSPARSTAQMIECLLKSLQHLLLPVPSTPFLATPQITLLHLHLTHFTRGASAVPSEELRSFSHKCHPM